jgi:hypothetical protein
VEHQAKRAGVSTDERLVAVECHSAALADEAIRPQNATAARNTPSFENRNMGHPFSQGATQ